MISSEKSTPQPPNLLFPITPSIQIFKIFFSYFYKKKLFSIFNNVLVWTFEEAF